MEEEKNGQSESGETGAKERVLQRVRKKRAERTERGPLLNQFTTTDTAGEDGIGNEQSSERPDTVNDSELGSVLRGSGSDSGTDGGPSGHTGRTDNKVRAGRGSSSKVQPRDGNGRFGSKRATADQSAKPAGIGIDPGYKPPKVQPKAVLPSVSEKVLSDAEVKKFKEPIDRALRRLFKYMDEFIHYTNKNRTECNVWKNTEDYEYEMIVGSILSLGQKSVVVAVTVREVSTITNDFEAAFILGEKLFNTGRFYIQEGGVSFR